MSGRKLARRACDACKIRKVKCSESNPCTNCENAKIKCTWLKLHQPRGPRRLRDATLQEIRKAQEILQQTQENSSNRSGTTRSPRVNDPDPPPEPSTEVAHLVLYLCVYRVQLYPVWPVIKVERLIASLQSVTPDVEVYALAYALAAATATRTQSTDLSIAVKKNHAQLLESKCQYYRKQVPVGRPPNLTTVRIAFFLHIYYEGQASNRMQSMLFLREAVTIATMMGLHKESYYHNEVPEQERQLRRRVLWLLYITERVISVLYEQPITLRTRIDLPSTTDTDDADTLVGFQQFARLFWKLDEQGMFQMLDELDVQPSPSSNTMSNMSSNNYNYDLDIQTDAAYPGYIPPVQALDLTITRCWLHTLNHRIQSLISTNPIEAVIESVNMIVLTGEEAVAVMSRSQHVLFEVLGVALRLKTSTISGVLQELLSNPVSVLTRMGPNFHERCTELNTKLLVILQSTYPALPYHLTSGSVQNRRTLTSPNTYSPVHSSQQNNSPGRSDWFPDFAVSNNYEGLFDAVEMAGVQSSDAVQDLFSQTTLEHYSTFDEFWPELVTTNRSPPSTRTHHHWHDREST